MPLGLKAKSVSMFSSEAQSAAVPTEEVKIPARAAGISGYTVKSTSPSSSDSKPQINDVDRVAASAPNSARTTAFGDLSPTSASKAARVQIKSLEKGEPQIKQ
jgi:hypothetical protein